MCVTVTIGTGLFWWKAGDSNRVGSQVGVASCKPSCDIRKRSPVKFINYTKTHTGFVNHIFTNLKRHLKLLGKRLYTAWS